MPTSDARLISNDTTSPILSKKLRMSFDERLSVSRNLFNLSRKRVEILKRNQREIKRSRSIKAPEDDEWITSGKLGSRDAVLVFRTTILNCPNKVVESLSKSTDEPTKTSETITKQLPVKKVDSTITDVLKPKNTSSPIANSCNSSDPTKPIKICVGRKLRCELSVLRAKRFQNSLSSSENSIASDMEEMHDSEEAEAFAKNPGNKVALTEENEDDYDALVLASCDSMEDENRNRSEEGEDDNLLGIESSEDSAYADDMPASKLKITYKFMQTETKLLRKIFLRHGLTEALDEDNFNILWTGVHMKPDILRNLAPYQRVNHFPRSYELTRKDRMYKNIERMQHLRGMRYFDIVPQSFVLPLEYKDLVSSHNKHRGPWIVKPAASSRGRGIFIVNSPDQIPQDEQVLVSKYVVNPLCIDSHKCDLRVYVLVTSFDPLIIYLYKEGLVRLATVKYDRNADNLWNPCMHLCNYSINKYHSDYIKSNDAHDEDVGHKWTLSALLRHLKSQGCDTRQLMVNIEDLIIKSILSCAQSIIAACRMFAPNGNNCFELYGFDILIDDSLKPWLLEINLSPSMGVDSPLDAKVKACMITDLLTCIGIPAYSPSMRAHYDSKWTRYRNVNVGRRTNSAEPASSNNNNIQSKRCGNGATSSTPLTLEEHRIIRSARLQNARSGGFVRIFPTDDTMQRYGAFLDPSTGIPISTPAAQGQVSYCMALSHNYNQMLFNNLYGKDSKDKGAKEENSEQERLNLYECALEGSSPITFPQKRVEPKCQEEGKKLRKQILKLIDSGSELTQLQARQTFSLYLDAILRRLTQEPKDHHERLLLKFLNRVGGTIKAPVFFRNPQNIRIVSKARSAMIAKLLGDFLEQYNRDTEAYVDAFDHFGMIPRGLFNEFLSQAQESDLEAVLALHTNVTGTMPYLYNRCGLSVPATPPIPSGLYGFLRALPAMVLSGSGARDFNKYDGYYKNCDIAGYRSEPTPANRKGNNNGRR